MGDQQNLDIVRGGYEAFGRGDIEGLISRLADDVTWDTPGPSDLPTAGHGVVPTRCGISSGSSTNC